MPDPASSRASGRARLLRLVLLLALLLVTGCRPSPIERPGQTPYRVRDVRFEGNDGLDSEAIRAVLATRVNRYSPFEPVRYLNTFDLAADIDRIEVFYHQSGYFDARVVDHRVDMRDRERRPRAVVTFVIDEGEPSWVIDIVFATEQRSAGLPYAELVRDLPMAPGQRFDREVMVELTALMRERLQEVGHARARVDARAYVSRERREVLVYVDYEPGPVMAFGEITVEGNRRVPDHMLVEALPFETGERYRQSAMRLARRVLYDFNSFQRVDVTSSVEASPEQLFDDVFASMGREQRMRIGEQDELAARRGFVPALHAVAGEAEPVLIAQLPIDLEGIESFDPYVDVTVTVTESPAANYRFGLGQELAGGRFESFARANAVWRDVFGPLNRFELDARVGYVWLPNPIFARRAFDEITNDGATARLRLRYSRPRLIGSWDFASAIRLQRGVELTYNVLGVGADIGITRRFGYASEQRMRPYRLDLGYSFEYNREDVVLSEQRNTYRLAWLRAGFTVDHRDDPLSPRRGFYGELQTELGDPLLGEFLFVLVSPELRGYVPITRRLTLAARAQAGWIVNLPESNPVPLHHRFYAGGAQSFRGLPYRRLSPYRYRLRSSTPLPPSLTSEFGDLGDCLTSLDIAAGLFPNSRLGCVPDPSGGFFRGLLSIEPRYELGRDWLFVAAFFDVGTVQGRLVPDLSLGGEGLQMAVGAGLRLLTPIGPIRLDVGYRLTDGPGIENLSRFTVFLAVGEAF